MLDENLPTFRFRAAPGSPTDTLLHYTDRGTGPEPAFLVRRPDPSLAPSRNRYAAALADPSFPSIIYAEVLVEPEWQVSSTGPSSTSTSTATATTTTTPDPRGGDPLTPSAVSLHLYNPDQDVVLKHTPSGWNRSESWEFEMPERTFRVPSASRLDRDDDASPGGPVPKVVFRWKKDGRLSRDMTCYMCGRLVDGRKSKEPDITVALFSSGSSSGEGALLTVYEPNMRRVEVEDRKGLEVVLLLGAEAIRSLYLNHKGDPFNLSAGHQGSAAAAGKVKKQKQQGGGGAPLTPAAVAAAAAAPVMSGAQSPPPAPPSATSQPNQPSSSTGGGGDRERRDREEQDRIRRMLAEEEDGERRRREAEVERETERLRQMYGVPGGGGPPQTPPLGEGEDGGQGEGGSGAMSEEVPPLPPRPAPQSPPTLFPESPSRPQRPVSAGPYGPGQEPPQGPAAAAPPKSRIEGFVSALGPRAEGAAARASELFQGVRDREEEKRKKVQKKRSVHF